MNTNCSKARCVLGALALSAALSGCGHKPEKISFDPRDLLNDVSLHGTTRDSRQLAEVDLGQYFVTRREGSEKGTLFIRFHLYALVPIEAKEEFEKALSERGQRMRDSVIALVQKSDVDHLSDPSWGLIRSELIPTISKALRTTALRDVVFTTFSMDGD